MKLLFTLLLCLPVFCQSVPIASASFTEGNRYNALWPAHYVDGDTLNNTVCGDGNLYLGIDDTHNFDGAVTGTTWTNACSTADSNSSNQSVSILQGSPLVGSVVNRMSGFLNCNTTASDSATAKQDTLFCLNDSFNSDVMFMHTTRQGGSPSFARTNGGFLKSLDHGATWANWLAPSTALANGAPPSPITSNMLGGTNNPSGQWSSVLVVNYQPGGGTSPAVDGQDTYVYFTVPFSGSVYMMRVARSAIANLSGSDYQFYIGGDGTQSGAWSSSSASAVAIYTGSCVDTAPVQQISTLGRYMMFASCYVVQPSHSRWVWLESAKPWGPWRQIFTTDWNTQGYVDVRPLASTVSTAQLTANGNSFQVVFDGDYTTDGVALNSSGMLYQLHYGTVQLTAAGSSQLSGQAQVSGAAVLH